MTPASSEDTRSPCRSHSARIIDTREPRFILALGAVLAVELKLPCSLLHYEHTVAEVANRMVQKLASLASLDRVLGPK
ncbi:hypothetical protein Pst134EA_024356 [Puccinia striiformis f. sp. tritici]|uniref:hypothetical protein n=1 Tax=Puccinia striiformis f. sp. tritici TaxID=168172 RepID=UPI0020087C20|nr:hypothetical protein Pst134EA_024356 [Puccinia striiformis f. sp. tritici]KAH9444784.1 hypothetical protein Pst134EB_025043 [Puccinia striiformis f. sp. tritici]KAH9453485.1 hypothetical protein Pst134EA_024356 [Puccinia striiformis f. sp. tritici]